MFIPVFNSTKIINNKSAHLTTAERCAPTKVINIWLTAIYSVLDRVTADRQTHDYNGWALRCSNWLASIPTKLSRFNYFRLPLPPARRYASQGGSCVKPMTVLHLTVDGCRPLCNPSPHVCCTYSQSEDWLWLSGNSTACHSPMLPVASICDLWISAIQAGSENVLFVGQSKR